MSKKVTYKPEIKFSGLSKAQKRVALAQDVVDQVRAKRFVPERGTWCEFDDSELSELPTTSGLQQAFIEKKLEKCEVCALGALMMSTVLFKNKVTVGDMQDSSVLHYDGWSEADEKAVNQLHSIFPEAQLRLIELAFELGGGYFYWNEPESVLDEDTRAVKFGRRYKSENTRIVGIMNNIIKNNGTFKP